ncbi:MAG: outer membrane beta-barrel protein [Bacteroidales bacterium]|nr:outer membrane beta-barrel protein [Bacteroidales bacterium]
MKNIIRPAFLLFVFFSVGLNTLFGQGLSQKEKEIIHTEAYNLIQAYESTLNKIAENSSTNEAVVAKMKNEFMQLFLNRQIMIYNDLEPSHQYSEFYEVETYISNLILWYPDGMHVSFDYSNIETPGIKPHKDNIWFLDIHVEKQISGNYMNRTNNQNKEDLSFRVAFTKHGKKVSNFQIVGIRNVNSTTVISNDKALQELNKAEYTDEELIQVQTSAKSLLMDYNRSLELLGNPEESAENKEYFALDFLSLFESEEVFVFNDIEPKPEQELIDVKTYVQQYNEYYPAGISNLTLNLDSATYSHIEETEDGKFQTWVYVDKFFSGNFRDKQKFSLAEPLIFTISIDKADGAFQNLAIASIDKEYADFSGINTITDESENLSKLTPIRRLGSSIGLSAMGGLSTISNQNLNNITLSANGHEWTTKSALGYSFGLDFYNYFNERAAFISGLQYSYFETTYSISGQYINPEDQSDPNSKYYIQNIDASIDSSVMLKYIGVPLGIEYLFEVNKKISLYFDAGINLSFLFNSECKLDGYYYDYGYYASNPEVLQEIYEPELGFRISEYTPIDEIDSPNNTTLDIIGQLDFGLFLRTGYYTTLKIGPKINYGLTSVYSPDNYYDVFHNKLETKPTRTNNFGFEISLIKKL